jgi:hypothetical protein
MLVARDGDRGLFGGGKKRGIDYGREYGTANTTTTYEKKVEFQTNFYYVTTAISEEGGRIYVIC